MKLLSPLLGIFLLFLIHQTSVASIGCPLDDSLAKKDTSYWSIKPTLGLFFAQHSFSEHFKGGGLNSIATSSNLEVLLNYQHAKNSWNNRIVSRYGVIKIDRNELQKNQDHLELDSKYSHQINKHLQISGLLNFTTKFHDFYEVKKTGERGKRIGNFLSPAYLNIGSGIDYVTKDKTLSIFYTPLNSKITIVADPTLIEQYLPHTEENASTKYELGSLVRLELKREIFKNIFIHSIGNLFTNHLQDFGDFDVKFENQFNFKVNKFFSVNLMTSLIYDEDILFDITTEQGDVTEVKKGPRTQFKEILNVGLSHTF